MMLTIVIILVVMIFAFSLILISYSLYSSQTKNLSGARNAEAVNTFSNALEQELTDADAVLNSNLWKYLRCNIAYPNNNYTDWPYYYEDDNGTEAAGHDRESAYRYFTMERNSDIEGFPAVVSVGICWMLPEDTNDTTISAELANLSSDDLSTTIMAKNGIRMRVEITAESGSQIYRTTDIYELKVFEEEDSAETKKVEAMKGNAQYNPASHEIKTEERWIWSLVERK